MKNTIITIIVIIILVVAGYYLYTGFSSAPAEVPAGDSVTTETPAAVGATADAPATDEAVTETDAASN